MTDTRFVYIPADKDKGCDLRYDELNLRRLQYYVGGYIEGILCPAVMFYVNEEGTIHGLPHNDRATRVLRAERPEAEWHLCGDVVVLGPPDDQGDDTDVPLDFVLNHMHILY